MKEIANNNTLNHLKDIMPNLKLGIGDDAKERISIRPLMPQGVSANPVNSVKLCFAQIYLSL